MKKSTNNLSTTAKKALAVEKLHRVNAEKKIVKDLEKEMVKPITDSVNKVAKSTKVLSSAELDILKDQISTNMIKHNSVELDHFKVVKDLGKMFKLFKSGRPSGTSNESCYAELELLTNLKKSSINLYIRIYNNRDMLAEKDCLSVRVARELMKKTTVKVPTMGFSISVQYGKGEDTPSIKMTCKDESILNERNTVSTSHDIMNIIDQILLSQTGKRQQEITDLLIKELSSSMKEVKTA